MLLHPAPLLRLLPALLPAPVSLLAHIIYGTEQKLPDVGGHLWLVAGQARRNQVTNTVHEL